jgi:hypothetical protein
MNLRDTAVGFVSGLGLAGAVAAIFWLLGSGKAGPNSPIRIVGGSVKFKADGAWGTPTACSGLPCLIGNKTVDATNVLLDGQTELMNLYSWRIDISVFNKDASSTQVGATVYPSDNAGNCSKDGLTRLCIASAASYITSQNLAATSYFTADLPYDKQNARPRRRYRYRDTLCCLDGSEDYRESISQITISYKTSAASSVATQTTCDNGNNSNNGECKAMIGK